MFPPLPFFQDAMEDCIIFSIDDEPPSSPPRSLLPLMLTCRRFYDLLRPSNNPRLYRRIFYRKFDTAALERRFPSSSIDVAAHFFPELKRRFQAMRCIRSGDVHHPQLQDAFLAAYLMVLEHDALNYRHLLDAALPALLDRYISERLHRGHNLWPVEDTCNALAVALFWHMTSQGALNGESDSSRDNIMDILLPLTFAWFRYSFAEQGFDPHTLLYGRYSTPRSSHRAHPPDPLSPVSIDYLGHALRLQLPAIALSASLAYFARLDAFPLSPVSREPGQIDSPTVEDIEFTSQSFRTRTVPRGPGFPDSDLPIGSVSPSARHDWDWLRGVAEGFSGSLRRYTPGILAGKWRGTALAPYDRDFTPFVIEKVGPASIPGQSRLPISCSLEEHVRYHDSSPMSCPAGDEWDDTSLIPLLPSTTWARKEDGIELSDGQSDTKVFYKTFNRENPSEESENVQNASESDVGSTTRADQKIIDVILSGNTEAPLQQSWGNFEYSGRVRVSDGLVVLVRQSLNTLGDGIPHRTIYAGYVMSSQNLVGKWKYCSPGAQWEGIWTMSKAE